MDADDLTTALRNCATESTHSKPASHCSSATAPSCTATTSLPGSSPVAPVATPPWPPSTGVVGPGAALMAASPGGPAHRVSDAGRCGDDETDQMGDLVPGQRDLPGRESCSPC